jgi:hypothetical protein
MFNSVKEANKLPFGLLLRAPLAFRKQARLSSETSDERCAKRAQ